eukprot:TRINITY_DN546_c0_g2_i1.p1 TRINITY_DN546_c0_g2~~TRINITY_DN546_c0_g2_i1.p1  ORF type:complete len:469 (-),score=127.14 TRINITY_DN546_c0_g2_i1:41-1447(-)
MENEAKEQVDKSSKNEESSSSSGGTSGPLTGKISIVTGSNSGIGKAIAQGLALNGSTVVMACRSQERADQAKADILEQHPEIDPSLLDIVLVDLGDLATVREFVKNFKAKYSRLDRLVCNAGLVNTSRIETKAGLEQMFAVNYLGHFLLVNLLLDTLKSTSITHNIDTRIVYVGSEAHGFAGPLNIDEQLKTKQDFSLKNSMSFYGRSKLCNFLAVVEFARRLSEDESKHHVTINTSNPGAVDTQLQRETPWYLSWIVKPVSKAFFKTPEQGARSTMHACIAEEAGQSSGKYYDGHPTKLKEPKPYAKDEQVAKDLWEYAETLVGPLTEGEEEEKSEGKKKKKKGKKKWERIVELLEIEGNYKRYRAEVKKEGVKVPIMGVVLQDLLFADEGNKGELEGVGGKGRKILNVVKWKMVGGMVEEVKEWQKENYCLESVDGLQRYLLEGIETSKGEGELFNLSLLREPRSK